MPSIPYVDGSCAIVSLVMFVYIFVNLSALTEHSTCQYKNKLVWMDNMNSKTASFQNTLAAYKSEAGLFCSGHNGNVFEQERKWDDNEYAGSYITYKASCFEASVFLIVIFVISGACQLYRACLYAEGSDDMTDDSFLLYKPAQGPQFLRWLEYALTTPLEIVLISSSVFIADSNILFMLATLQVSLMFMGFLVELLLKNIQDLPDSKSERTIYSEISSVWAVFAIACFMHGVIWYIVFAQLYQQTDLYESCSISDARELKVPDIVHVIIYGQFVLFSLFGLAQFLHVYYITELRRTTTNMYENKNSWEYMAVVYSTLSVVSKTLLGVSFVVYVQLQ